MVLGESLSDETVKKSDMTVQRKDALVREAIELLRRADEVLGSIIGVQVNEYHDLQ
jgi:hypothetical protein